MRQRARIDTTIYRWWALLSVMVHLLRYGANGLVAPSPGHCCKPKEPSLSSIPSPEVNSLGSFVQMRSGIGPEKKPGIFSDVVFWTADGELYESPSGKMLARIEGVETSHAVRLENGSVRIFSRKLVWFLDPETNEIMNEFEGKTIAPIRYDAQVFDMEQGRNDEKDTSLSPILPYVVRSKRLVPCMPITPRWGGCKDILMFQVPLFIDIEIPINNPDDEEKKTRRYQAWEFYDYSLNMNYDNPPILSWMRQGSTPPFCMDSSGVMHARGHRVESFEELPQSTQDYVNKNYPLFRGPPRNMEEVDQFLGKENF